MNAVRFSAAMLVAVSLSGCITDKPVVYKKHVIKQDAMQKFLGDYVVEKWPGDDGPKRVRAYEKDGKHYLAWRQDEDIEVMFLLSKTPDSKKDVHILTMPKQGETNKENLFFVGRVDKGKTMLWVAFPNQPVMKGKVKKNASGQLSAEDVRHFFAKHADEYVEANQPQVILTRKSK